MLLDNSDENASINSDNDSPRNNVETKSNADPVHHQTSEDMVLVEESEAFNPKASRIRSNSADGTLVEVSPILTTGWFDTNDEFENHRKKVKNRFTMRMSGNAELDEQKSQVYKSYRNMGGMAGSLIMGGPDAFDVSSKGGLGELMGSIGGYEDEKE